MGGQKSAAAPTRLDGMVVQSSIAGRPIPKGWGTFRISPNLLWYGAFQSQSQTQSAGGKGGGGSVTSYTYSASVVLGICAGPIAGVSSVYVNQSAYTDGGTTALAQAGLSVNLGAMGQATWSYLTTNFPAQAIGYSGIAIAYAANLPLSGSGTLPNYSFEVYTADRVAGLPDANPETVLASFIPSIPFWATGLLDATSLADYANYALAASLLVSPVLDSQRAGSDFVKEILTASNTDVVWSEGVLKFVPYGDTQITGNGVTWTPNLTPAYDLNPDDFIPSAPGEPAVLVSIKKQADSYNYVQVDFLDRTNQYNPQTVPGVDQASIDQWGKRPNPSPVSLHSICDPGVAAQVAQLLVQRTSLVRKTYAFRTSDAFCLVEPQRDLLTLTAGELNRVLVRVTAATEVIGADGSDEIEFEAEEMLVGTAHAAALTRASSTGYAANYFAAPGSVTDYALINSNRNLTGGDYELWIGASGDNANWGGCHVWVSVGGGEYLQVGSIYSKARMGTLTTALAIGADPDNTNTCRVDVSTTEAQLLTGVQADQDNATTLCLVDNELIAYRDATLVSSGVYTLAHLRRGLYHSTIAAHAIGATFVRLDEAMFRWSYAAAQVGATLSVKLQSFNLFGNAAEDLGTVTAHNVVLSPGAAPIIDLTASGISGSGGAVYDWTYLVNFLAPVGSNAIVNSEFVTGAIPPTGWMNGLNSTGLTLTSTIVTANGRKAGKGTISGTPAVGTQFDAYTQDTAKLANYLMPCLGGEWVGASARACYQNCSGVQLYLVFYDASGSVVSASNSGAVAGANANGDTVDPSAYGYISMVKQAPATARWAQLVVRALCDGAHASPAIWFMEPLITRLPDNATAQTAVPKYQPGPALRDATPNILTRSTGAPASPNLGDIWVQLDSNNRATGIASWNGTSWATVATSNNITSSTSAPSTPTIGDVWVQLDGSSRVTGIATWNGSGWVNSATANYITRSGSAPSTPTVGDVWVQLDGNGRVTGMATWNGSSWINAATTNNITRSASSPSAPTVGDIWVQLDANSRVTGIATWNGSSWGTAATSNTVTRSIGAPSAPVAGDVWVQLDSNSRATSFATWNGSSWVQASTNNVISSSSSAPSTPTINDIWVDTTTSGKPVSKVWNGSAWVAASIPSAVVQYLDAAGNIVSVQPMPGSVPYGMGAVLSAFPFTTDDSHIYVAAFDIKNYGASDVHVSATTIPVPTADTVFGVVVIADGSGIGYIDPASLNTFLMSTATKWVYLGAVRTQKTGNTGYSPSVTVSGAVVNSGMGVKYASNFPAQEP